MNDTLKMHEYEYEQKIRRMNARRWLSNSEIIIQATKIATLRKAKRNQRWFHQPMGNMDKINL